MQPDGRTARRRVVVLTTAVGLFVAGLQLTSAAAARTPAGSPNGASSTTRMATTQSTMPIPIGDGWVDFPFGGQGSVAGPFSVSSQIPVVLSVTDAFCLGDRFEILDRGTVVATTSTPALPRTDCRAPGQTEDPQTAFLQGLYAAGMVLLGPGEHAITIRAIRSPFGGGAGFLRVDRCTRFLTRPGRLTGTAGNDTLCGSLGNDTIIGRAGHDRIAGGRGNDLLQGGEGADAIAGGPGTDLLAGQDGTDRLFGDAGLDLAAGGPGHDGISGGAAGDALLADDGLTNVVVGDEGSDRLSGGHGDDLLNGGSGNDLLQGAGGTDRCIGGPGVDAAVGCERLQGIP